MNFINYSKNMLKYEALDRIDLSGIEQEEELISALIDISTKKREIQLENNRILSETLFYYREHPSLMTHEISEEFREFYRSLHKSGTPVLTYLDRNLSKNISELLLSYYNTMQDLDGMARQTILLHYFQFILIEHSGESLPPKEYKEFRYVIDHFDDISPDARRNAIAYLLAHSYDPTAREAALFRFQEALNFLETHTLTTPEQDYLKEDPILYYSLIDSMASTSDWILLGNTLTEEQKTLYRKTKEMLEKELQDNELRFQYPRAYLAVQEAAYHLGEITLEDFLSSIQTKSLTGTVHFYNDENAYLLFYTSRFIRFLWQFSQKTPQECLKITEPVIHRVLTDMRDHEDDNDTFYTVSDAVEFILAMSNNLGFERTGDSVLKMTVLENKALYIHTLMVKRIGEILLTEILSTAPEFLTGVAEYDISCIESHPMELLQLWSQCAMFHDIGKHYCMDYVSNSSRNLFEEEFELIKFHPTNFEKFFTKSSGPKFDCIRDCAKYHHVWHNGKGGYPAVEVYDTKNRPFVDILSIADSIDAATDLIGRPYAARKTLEELAEEFEAFRDTRYSGFVTDILKRPHIMEKINHTIQEERKHINYKVYHKKDSMIDL